MKLERYQTTIIVLIIPAVFCGIWFGLKGEYNYYDVFVLYFFFLMAIFLGIGAFSMIDNKDKEIDKQKWEIRDLKNEISDLKKTSKK